MNNRLKIVGYCIVGFAASSSVGVSKYQPPYSFQQNFNPGGSKMLNSFSYSGYLSRNRKQLTEITDDDLYIDEPINIQRRVKEVNSPIKISKKINKVIEI